MSRDLDFDYRFVVLLEVAFQKLDVMFVLSGS